MEEENKNTQENESSEVVQDVQADSSPEVVTTTETATETTPEVTKNSNRNLIIGIAVALAVLAAGYLFLQSNGPDKPEVQQNTAFEPIESTLEVARVNDVSLYGKDLTLQMAQAAQLAGIPSLDEADAATIELIQAQSLDAIINTQLISQASEAAGNTVTSEEVDIEFAALAESIGGDEVAAQRLAELGVTVEEFKENLVDDILIRKYMESTNIDLAVAVTEEEIQAFYDEVTGGQVEGMPTLEDARAQIEEQLQFQKQQEILVTIITELRVDANIEILI